MLICMMMTTIDKAKNPMAITGTSTLLTFAIRWMPPKTMAMPIAANAIPVTTGGRPNASCHAPQMVLA